MFESEAELRKNLWKITTEEIHEFAWRSNWPIQPAFAIPSMTKAMESEGFNVTNNPEEENVTFQYTPRLAEKQYNLTSSLTYEQILRGWGSNPKGSPRCLYNSMAGLFDKIRDENLPEKYTSDETRKIHHEWEEYRESTYRNSRAKMDELLEPEFSKYHESVLVPFSGKMQAFDKPTVFETAFAQHPYFKLYSGVEEDKAQRNVNRMLKENNEGYSVFDTCGAGPTEQTLIKEERIWDELVPGEYYPSDATLTSFFRGHVIFHLLEKLGVPEEYFTLDKCVSRCSEIFPYHKVTWNDDMANKEWGAFSTE